MTRLYELASKLSPEQLQAVEDFAEFLVSRPPGTRTAPAKRKFIDVDGLSGLCAGMGGDKTSVELAHEATEARAAKYDDAR